MTVDKGRLRSNASSQKAIFSTDAISQPRRPQAGKVKIQVHTIFRAIPHLTAERRLVAPTPIIAVLMQCVVLTGIPKCEATSMTLAAETLAANPWTGRNVVIFNPSVRITRRPPIAVPKLIEAADATIIHHVLGSNRER